MRIKQYKVPYIPPQIQPEDLQENGKLFTEEEIRQIREVAREDGRYRHINIKDDTGKSWLTKLRYAVIAKSGEFYAIYSGQHPLGKGSYGKVKLAQNLWSGEWHALKVQEMLSKEIPHIKQERDLLDKLGLNVQAGADCQPVIMERWSVRKKKQQHYMLMKYQRGLALFDVVTDESFHLGATRWIKLVLNLLQHVKSIHERSVLHRDIKLENVIAALAEDEISLVDFGFAAEMSEIGEVMDRDCVGSPWYVAPEIISVPGLAIYNEKTEVYALGALIAILLGFAYPYTKKKLEGAQFTDKIKFYSEKQIAAQDKSSLLFEPSLRVKMREFLCRMVHADPAQRPTIAEAQTHFKTILEGLNNKPLSVGLLDVDACEREAIADMVEDLGKYDYVWLVDKELKPDPYYYAKIRHELEKAGVRVGDRLYSGVDAQHLQAPLLEKLTSAGGVYVYNVESVIKSYLPDIARFGIFSRYFLRSERVIFDQKDTWPTTKRSESVAGVLSQVMARGR